MKQVNNEDRLWRGHPLRAPHSETLAVYEGAGQRFAISRSKHYTDPGILSLTRHYSWGDLDRLPASAGLAMLRRQLKRDFPSALAIEVYASLAHHVASYIADSWVFIADDNALKRFIRTL